MTVEQERMQILNMVAEGIITADEGARLLAALEPTQDKRAARPPSDGPTRPRWFRIRVTDLETGRTKVNVSLPLSLIEIGGRIGSWFSPDLEGVRLQELVQQIKDGAQGKIIDVEDMEDGEHVEIYVE